MIRPLAAFLLLSATSFAAPPDTIAIQGRIDGPGGEPLLGTRNWRVRFFDAPTLGFQIGGDATGSVSLGPTGRFSLEVAPPAGIRSAAQVYYEIAIDSAPNPDGLDSGDVFPDRVRLHSVPFALSAQDAATLAGQPASSYATDADITLAQAYSGGRSIAAASGDVALSGAGGLTSEARIESAGALRLSASIGGTAAAQLARTADGGKAEAFDEAGRRVLNLGAATGGHGGVGAIRMANENNVGVGLIGDGSQSNGGGQVNLFNGAQQFAAGMSVSASGSGLVDTYPGGGANNPVTTLGVNSQQGGYVGVSNSAGSARVLLTQLVGGEGALAIYDNANQLGVLIAPSGKSFVAPNPEKAGGLIRYVCLEGGEAGIYARGRGRLDGGATRIDFPAHFRSLVAEDTVTITLTPRSAASKGLAAENATAAGFDAKELLAGSGTYDFDWVAWGVRRGYEDFQVEIDAADLAPDRTAPKRSAAAPDAKAALKMLGAAEATP